MTYFRQFATNATGLFQPGAILLAAGLLLTLPLGGCSLLDPLLANQAGSIAQRSMEPDDALRQLIDHNRRLRNGVTDGAMSQPARPGSGLVGEIDVTKALEKSNLAKPASGEKPRQVRLDFENVSLRDVITAFMTDYIKAPYSFQDSYKDRTINLVFDATATRQEIIALFDSLLDANGVKVRKNGNIFLIGSADEPPDGKEAPTPGGPRLGDAFGLFKLKFLEAKEFLALAKQTLKQPEKLVILPGQILMANTSQADLRAIDALIKDIDVPAFMGKHILVYNPRYLTAASLVAVLDSYQSQLSSGTPSAVKQFEAKQIPEMERVVIVAANKTVRDLVMQFLAQADVISGNARQIFHYPLSMQTAPDLAPTLLSLIKPILRNPTEVNVVADKVGNSLLIFASPAEYAEIRKLLDRLDHRPPSVQVEVAIAEVRLSNAMRYGVEWYLKSTGNLIADIATTLIPTDFTAPALAAGIVDKKSNFATLQLLANETSFSLLSNPRIVVRNGATAKINVGSEDPIPKGKLISGTSTQTTVEVEFKKIGLELEVTPWVTNNNEIRMVIKVKDDTIVGTKLIDGNSYPVLANREVKTDLIAADGSTVFLGGMRRQSAEDTMVRVPGLAELPYLGAGFRNKKIDDNGTELIILATPNLILDQQGADLVLQALLRSSNQKFADIRPGLPPPVPWEFKSLKMGSTLFPRSPSTVPNNAKAIPVTPAPPVGELAAPAAEAQPSQQ